MRRPLELLLILAARAVLFQPSRPSEEAPPEICFRFSREGATPANFFFQLEDHEWIAMYDDIGTQTNALDRPPEGIWTARGQLNDLELPDFLGCEGSGAWRVTMAPYYDRSCPVDALLAQTGSRFHKVARFRTVGNPDAAHLVDSLYRGLPGQVEEMLRNRRDRGLAPDGPPMRRRDVNWPLAPLRLP